MPLLSVYEPRSDVLSGSREEVREGREGHLRLILGLSEENKIN